MSCPERSRPRRLPTDWPRPLPRGGIGRIPLYVRSGSLLVTYPAEHVRGGLGDTPQRERPLEATLFGEPPLGRVTARLADGTRIRFHDGDWSVTPERRLTVSAR